MPLLLVLVRLVVALVQAAASDDEQTHKSAALLLFMLAGFGASTWFVLRGMWRPSAEWSRDRRAMEAESAQIGAVMAQRQPHLSFRDDEQISGSATSGAEMRPNSD